MFPQEEQGKQAAEHITGELISKLTAFRTLSYMHEIDKKKKVDLEEIERQKKLIPPKEEEKKEEGEEGEEEKAEVKEEVEEDEEKVEERKKEERKKKQEEEDAKYGRYMIWEGILQESCYPEWKAVADQMDGINPHVVEDIQDNIIRESFQPEREEGKKLMEEAKKKMEDERKEKLLNGKEKEKEMIRIEMKLEKLRPDKGVWNFFLEAEGPYKIPHKFRYY